MPFHVPLQLPNILRRAGPRAGDRLRTLPPALRTIAMLTLLIGILITIVIGAILFWIIDKFAPEARLAQLLKLLVVLLCLASIVSRLYPLLGAPSVL
jgi:ABC-type bacteriocin/lantibiotic exporter with double-glycine peptidase domain